MVNTNISVMRVDDILGQNPINLCFKEYWLSNFELEPCLVWSCVPTSNIYFLNLLSSKEANLFP